MTKIQRVEFMPEHILSIKVDPIAEKLREGANLFEWARLRKKMGPTVSMAAMRPDHSLWIVACGGAVVLWPGTAELWMALDVGGGKLPRLPIEIRAQVEDWMRDLKLDRVQSTVDAGWPTGIRFLEWLGMEREAVMRKLGPKGIDQMLYARVK